MRSTTGSFSLTSIIALVLLSLIALIPAAHAQAKPKPAPTDKVELGVVVGAIKDALAESEKYEVPAFPAFQSATVSVATTVEKEVGGQIKLYVFNVGAVRTIDNASTLTFELLPPRPPAGAKVQSFNPVDIKNALAKQITAAKLGFVSANAQTKALQADRVEVQIQFTVKTQGTGGVDTGSILPIGITLNGKYSQQSGNVIKLVFSNKAQ
jgi:hypothetical protein